MVRLHEIIFLSRRIGELMKEVVDKYGVTWVASAGNHGPALSTVGTPPWVNANTIIGKSFLDQNV